MGTGKMPVAHSEAKNEARLDSQRHQRRCVTTFVAVNEGSEVPPFDSIRP